MARAMLRRPGEAAANKKSGSQQEEQEHELRLEPRGKFQIVLGDTIEKA